MAFDGKISKSTHSKISKNSSGKSSVEESKAGVLPKSALKSLSARRTASTRVSKTHGRVRTLSNSDKDISSSKDSNDDQAAMSDDSWTVSHDMLMIDEVHTSEESENLS